jgi:phosphoglycolate phosphatase
MTAVLSSTITPIRAVAIDLDGTLVDTMGEIVDAVNDVMGYWSLPLLTRQTVQSNTGHGSSHLLEAAFTISGKKTMAPHLLAEALSLFQRSYAQRLGSTAQLYPGVEDGLSWLAESGLPLACTTNKISSHAEPLLARLRLRQWFKVLVCADTAGARKPDPTMLYLAAAQLRQPVAAMAVIGDSRNDALAAQAAGCRMIGVSMGYGDAHQLAAMPGVELVPSFNQAVARIAPARQTPHPIPTSA